MTTSKTTSKFEMNAQAWMTVIGFLITIVILAATVTYNAGRMEDRVAHIEADVSEIRLDIRAMKDDIHDIDIRLTRVEEAVSSKYQASARQRSLGY